MLGFLLGLVNPLAAIGQQLANAYAQKQDAQTAQQRIAADERIAALEAQRDVVIAASINDKWWSPRTIMGWSAAAYVFKIVVWDTVFQLGVTPDPGAQVTYIVMTVVGFYFVTKGVEAVANTVAGAVRRK